MKFRHKNGGVCEVRTEDAVNKMKNNPEYQVFSEAKSRKSNKADTEGN
ncbi:MAG: hypothetical protein NC213_10275 [Acetobacter sp.]|nr:hypothetical protein [Bacteroides sp.]MCM1342120.1 hypothetical protein [Acetobacter sp.]MCM1434339.1 hypothetical protein [Clostridiales bacterium]